MNSEAPTIGIAPLEKKTIREPFKIRAHHLLQFELLIKKSAWDPLLPPDALIYLAVKNYRRFQSFRNEADSASNYRATYADDIIGTSIDEEVRYSTQARQVFNLFIQLPPDAPVDIVIGPDNLCGACIKGRHCVSTVNFDGDEIIPIDNKHLETFVKYVRQHPEIEIGKMIIGEETIDFEGSNPGPKVVKRVQTTAGTVKNVLTTNRLPWGMIVAM